LSGEFFFVVLLKVLDPINLLWLFGGLISGIMLGAVPGIGPGLAIILLIPITFHAPLEGVFIMMAAIYCAGTYAGAISSILLRIPGDVSSAVTALDGYPLALKGQAGKAIGVALFASGIGGILGSLAMLFLSGYIAAVAINFTAAEYFALTVLALTSITSVAGKSISKGLVAALIGLLIPVVGFDQITGVQRFVFSDNLRQGFHFGPVLVGAFAFSEVFRRSSSNVKVEVIQERVKTIFPNFQEIKGIWKSILRSSVIGTFIGALPAVGPTTAGVIGYSEAVRWSKNPDQFGKGSLEGVAAPEAATNAAAPASLIPLFALGLPGSIITALMFAAFLLHGLRPGPLLFVDHPQMVYTILIGVLITNILILAIGGPLSSLFSRIINIPYNFMIPFILVLAMIGAYSMRGATLDLWTVLGFGILGYFMSRYQFPIMPMVLGVVLGNLAEINLRRALLITGGDVVAVVSRPITATILSVSILALIVPAVLGHIRKKNMSKQCSA
jgi:putative tricarboxylic transport membrane protein